jgi:hypothetical protein
LSRHLGRSLELSMGMSSDYPIGTLWDRLIKQRTLESVFFKP